MEPAPEPDDVYWESFKYSDNRRIWLTLLSVCMNLIVVGISFGISYGFECAKDNMKSEPTDLYNQLLSYLSAYVMTRINKIIHTVISMI